MRWLHLLGWVAAVGALLPLLAITRSTTATACQFNDYICPQPWCTPQLQDLRGEMCRMDNTSLLPACCEGWCAIFSCEPNTDPHCGQALLYPGQRAEMSTTLANDRPWGRSVYAPPGSHIKEVANEDV